MTGGYTGRLLEIDLTSRRHITPETDMKAAELFLGGRGMGIKSLWDRIPSSGLDPLSPANPLMFWTGPLSGLPLAGASRVSVVTKAANTSPDDPALPHASTVTYSSIGGHFGPALKQAGFDALITVGRSDGPVALIIDNEKVSFRNAADLWGQTATKAIEILSGELGPDYHLLAIGPAGENGVRFAGIVSDVRRTTARGGAGAVMGAKNLKAIAVRGTLPLQAHNSQGLFALRRDIPAILAAWSNYAHCAAGEPRDAPVRGPGRHADDKELPGRHLERCRQSLRSCRGTRILGPSPFLRLLSPEMRQTRDKSPKVPGRERLPKARATAPAPCWAPTAASPLSTA